MYRLIAFVFFCGLGYLVNGVALPISLGSDFLFGGAVAFFAIAVIGPVLGIMVAMVSALQAAVEWGHNYGWMIQTLQALFVGLAYSWIGRPNLLYLCAAFWALIGAPVVWLFYIYGLHLGEATAELAMVTLAINGVVNAGIAELLLSVVVHATGRRRWLFLDDHRKLERSFADGVSNLIVGFVLLSMISETAVFSRTQVSELLSDLSSKAQIFFNVSYSGALAESAEEASPDGSAEAIQEAVRKLMERAANLAAIDGLTVSVVDRAGLETGGERESGAMKGLERYEFAGATGYVLIAPGTPSTLIERLRRAYWVREFPAAGAIGATGHRIRVAIPMEVGVSRLQRTLVQRYLLIAGILVACFLFVPLTTRRFIRPLSELAAISHELISDRAPDREIAWPRSRYVELEGIWRNLNALFRNLREVRKEERASRILHETIAHELRQLIDTANAPIFGIDADGRVNEWNQTMERITGFSKGETLGRDLVEDFITDDYRQSVREVLDKALCGEEMSNYEFPLYTKAGDRVDVLLNSTTRRDTGGRITGVVGVGQDITEVNMSRIGLESIAHELTQLIDTANAPIFGIDNRGRVNEWNQTAERITGFTKAEVIGRDLVEDFITDDYKSSVRDVLDRALQGRETANYEFPLYTKEGDRVDVLLNSTTRRDANGRIVGVVGVGQDITEVKNSQQQVIHASKLATLGEMATAVAHELNQPLNVIRMAVGNCELRLESGAVEPEYVLEKLTRINEQVSRAAAIIDHMRMFGRKTPEEAIVFDLRDTIASTLDLIGEQLRLSGIHVTNHISNAPLRVRGHPLLLEQTLLNLLTNARDAIVGAEGKAGRVIAVRAFREDRKATIEVEDWGGGIPEPIIGRIFEPFFTTKEMGKGTGLGLSVSYGIVRDMNGTIVAHNTGSGAVFSISIPLARDSGEGA